MQFNCEMCGRAVQKPTRKKEHIYCKECAVKVTRTILNQDAAARREIKRLGATIEDVTDGAVRISESTYYPTTVLVYHGIETVALLLGEEIQVAENEKDGLDRWLFFFHHDGVAYHAYGLDGEPETKRILKKWRQNHETF